MMTATRTTIAWTPEIDAKLVSLRSQNPEASQARLAELLAAVAGVPATKKAVGNRLERLTRSVSPVAAAAVELPLARVAAAPMTYLKGALPNGERRDGELVCFVGDTQYPYEDPKAHALLLAWLRDERPSRIYLTGDILDVYQLSRFGADGGARRASFQEELAYAHARLAEIRAAAGPDAVIYFIAGNHEERLTSYVARLAEPLIGLRRVGSDDEVLSLPYLIAIDDLGITWVGKRAGDLGGDYVNAQIAVTPTLIATHGYHSRKGGGGASVLPIVHQWDASVVGGHDHRQGVAMVSRGGVAGVPLRRLQAVSTGMMCRQRLGYNAAPDWQLGFATAAVFADGSFAIDLATIDPVAGVIAWRGRRWGAR